jgi:hypothetical protein
MSTSDKVSQPRDKDAYARDHFDEVTRRYLLSVLTDEIIAEHRSFPAHMSEPLSRIVAWCQRRPLKEQYAVKAESDGTYRIIRFSGVRGQAPTYASDERFATLGEARHGAFLHHIKDLTGQ